MKFLNVCTPGISCLLYIIHVSEAANFKHIPYQGVKEYFIYHRLASVLLRKVCFDNSINILNVKYISYIFPCISHYIFYPRKTRNTLFTLATISMQEKRNNVTADNLSASIGAAT